MSGDGVPAGRVGRWYWQYPPSFGVCFFMTSASLSATVLHYGAALVSLPLGGSVSPSFSVLCYLTHRAHPGQALLHLL